MSISSALSNALSGLTASSKRAEVVSNNVANVMTEGYARRELNLEAGGSAGLGGVRVNGITRIVNEQTVAARRNADADLAGSKAVSSYFGQLEDLVGGPLDGFSLSAAFSDFEASLDTAISRPDLTNRLEDVATKGEQVVNTFNRISDGVRDLREQSDRDVAKLAGDLGTLLKQVENLNKGIISADVNNRDASSLLDERQTIIDQISEIVPVKQLNRSRGEVALISNGGAVLLDGSAVDISFSSTEPLMPHMTLENGLASPVQVNGRTAKAGLDSGALGGGALGAAMTIRDELTVQAQQDLDAAAVDLVSRFQNSGLDVTLAPEQAGLFTDGGDVFTSGEETGLAGRLSLNPLVSDAGNNEAWRLRDGLGAVAAGMSGDASLLSKLKSVLSDDVLQPSGRVQNIFELGSALETSVVSDRLNAEQANSFSLSRQAQLKEMELADGVDTDAEMQKLLLIEQAYSANARVVQTINQLMDTLLRI